MLACSTDRSKRIAWIGLVLAIIAPNSMIAADARAMSQDESDEVVELSVDTGELDEREVWAGEVAGEPASLVMTPREATVDGVFFLWRGPVDPALRGAGGSAVITREGVRLAANFKLEDGRTPAVQLEVPDTGVWKIEVIPPVVDAATVFAKPISFSVTAGESKVEAPRERRPIRRFFRRPEVRYTIMGVGCFVLAIGIIVYRYRG
jgi:hypothetical protein